MQFFFNSTAVLFSNSILITPRHSILVLNAQVAYILARVPLANNSFFQAVLESYPYIFVIWSVFFCRFSSDEYETFQVHAVLEEQSTLMRKERSSANVW